MEPRNQRRPRLRPAEPRRPSNRSLAELGLAVGVVGGIYRVGSGSLLSPMLVGRRLPVTTLAPAALTSTFVTSIMDAATYVVLAAATDPGHNIAPDWTVGSIAGVGGHPGGLPRCSGATVPAGPTSPRSTRRPCYITTAVFCPAQTLT